MKRTLHYIALVAFLVTLAAFGAGLVVVQFGWWTDSTAVVAVFSAFEAVIVGLIGGLTIAGFGERHTTHAKKIIGLSEKMYLGMYEGTAVRPLRILGLDDVGETMGRERTALDREVDNVLGHFSSVWDKGTRVSVRYLRSSAVAFTKTFDEQHDRIVHELVEPAKVAFPGLELDYHSERHYVRVDAVARVVRTVVMQKQSNPRYEGPSFGIKREMLDNREHLLTVHQGMPFWPLAELPDPQHGSETMRSFVETAGQNQTIIESVNAIEEARKALIERMRIFKDRRDRVLARTKPNDDLGGWCLECPRL